MHIIKWLMTLVESTWKTKSTKLLSISLHLQYIYQYHSISSVPDWIHVTVLVIRSPWWSLVLRIYNIHLKPHSKDLRPETRVIFTITWPTLFFRCKPWSSESMPTSRNENNLGWIIPCFQWIFFRPSSTLMLLVK